MELGLTKNDLKIIDQIIQDLDIDLEKYSKKQMLKIFHHYKKYRIKSIEEKRYSKKREFKKFVKYCLRRNLTDLDTMLLLTADKGAGKSSTGIELAREWCKLIGKNFDPKRHIAYDNADVMEKIQTLDKFEPLICDEAIRFATAEDWNKAENKELKKVLGQVRTKHLFFVLCFPLKITKLQKEYLDSYVNYWLDLYERGVAALYVKDKNPSKDSWNINLFSKMGSWNEFSTPDMVEKKLSNHPNYWQTLHIPKVPDKIYNNYLEVREHNVYNDKNVLKAMSKNDVNRAVLLLMLKEIVTKDGTYSYKRVIKAVERLFKLTITQSQLTMLMKDAEHLVNSYVRNGGNNENEE